MESMRSQNLRSKKVYLINILLPLITGAVFYIVLRSDTYIARCFYQMFHLEYAFEIKDNFCITFVRNYVCDMFWAYALMMTLWLALDKTELYKVSFIAFLFAAFVECSQIRGVIKGTFDIGDILLEGIAIGIASFVIKRIEKDVGDEYEKEICAADNGACDILDDGCRKRLY